MHEQYPQLLAEMYALTMAAANLTLPFSLVSHFMVSDPKTMSPTEAWTWIEDLTLVNQKSGSGGGGGGGGGGDGATLASEQLGNPTAVCAGATSTVLPTSTRRHASGDIALPSTVHYCQRYEAAGHVFAKRKMPHDFFKCDGEPMPFDEAKLLDFLANNNDNKVKRRQDTRTAFMLCHLIPMVNAALENYKRDVCGVDASEGTRGK